MEARCTIEMLGGLKVRQPHRITQRFRTQKTGALLAYLAYFQNRVHPRDTLIALLWPDAPQESGRNNLSIALSALRGLLEPPGVASGATVFADRFNVGINPQAVITDVAAFEAALVQASAARGTPEQHAFLLEHALTLWHGPLLPGYYEPWVSLEQTRLAETFQTAVVTLAHLHEAAGNRDAAVTVLRRATQVNPTREETHREIIRLLIESGQNSAALDEVRELRRVLAEVGQEISPQIHALLEPLRTVRTEFESALATPTQRTSTKKRGADGSAVIPTQPLVSKAADITSRDTIYRPSGGPFAQEARLPLTLSAFFGRTEECQRLSNILQTPTTRLVTITGPGGNGKTRLAVEVARGLAYNEPFTGEVYFVPLADVDKAASLPGAIAEALGLLRVGAETRDPWEGIGHALADRNRVLLLLDNFEQIAEEGAMQVQTLLERTLNVTCLVTSRVRLLIEGEREFILAPLSSPIAFPEVHDLATLQDDFPAVALFVDRAQQARPDFQINTRNAASIAELVTRLEGIPLAIELAAARASVLTPRDMLTRLNRRFDLLRVSERARRFPERHRSLWAAVEWSYRLLSPEVRAFFARLFVFRGGFTASAAESVLNEPLALDHLAVLRDASLLNTREINDGTLRFSLLETMREFAEEHNTPAERTTVLFSHARYFLDFAERAAPNLTEDDRRVWLDLLETEHDNLFTALHYYTFASEPEGENRRVEGLRLFVALDGFWRQRGFLSEARRVAASLLEEKAPNPAPPGLQGRAWHVAGGLALQQSDFEVGRAYMEQALRLWNSDNNEAGVMQALNGIGRIELNQGHYQEAEAIFADLLARRRILGDVLPITFSLNNLGLALFFQSCLPEARACFEEMLVLNRQEANTLGIAIGQGNLGEIALTENRLDEAEACFTEALALTDALGTHNSHTEAQRQMGWLRLQQNRVEEAYDLLSRSLRAADTFGQKAEIALCLEALACVAAVRGNHWQAAQTWGAAQALRERERLVRHAPFMPGNEVLLAISRNALGIAFEQEQSVGSALPLPQAIARVLAVPRAD